MTAAPSPKGPFPMFSRVGTALFSALLLALPACATEGVAGDGGPATPASEATGETAADLKGGPLFDDAQFPMSAKDFQQKLDERRAKMESFGKKRHHDGPPPGGGTAEEQAARKAKHDAKRAEFKAKIDAKVAEITADGTVTLDEAKELRGAFFAGRGGPGHHGPGGPGHHGPGHHGHGGPGGELESMTFPMPAADFRQKVDARRQQMKARFEEHAKDMPAEKVAEIRANVAQTESKVDAKLTEITADGTVTKEEADALRDVVMANFKRPGR